MCAVRSETLKPSFSTAKRSHASTSAEFRTVSELDRPVLSTMIQQLYLRR